MKRGNGHKLLIQTQTQTRNTAPPITKKPPPYRDAINLTPPSERGTEQSDSKDPPQTTCVMLIKISRSHTEVCGGVGVGCPGIHRGTRERGGEEREAEKER